MQKDIWKFPKYLKIKTIYFQYINMNQRKKSEATLENILN